MTIEIARKAAPAAMPRREPEEGASTIDGSLAAAGAGRSVFTKSL